MYSYSSENDFECTEFNLVINDLVILSCIFMYLNILQAHKRNRSSVYIFLYTSNLRTYSGCIVYYMCTCKYI